MSIRSSSREQQTKRVINEHGPHNQREDSPPSSWFPLVEGPVWEGHEIKHNDGANAVVIDRVLILCRSQTEYQTLMRFLQDPMECVPFGDLMPSFEYKRDRDTLGKRIQKLRRKLPPSLTIRCEIGEGYVLREMPRPQP